VRQRQQARPPAAVDAERDAVTGEATGEFVHHRHRQRRQACLLAGDGQHVEGAARALQGLRVVKVAPAQEQRLDPADSPVQLPEHGLQRFVVAFGDIEHHRSLQVSVEFDGIGDDHQRAGLTPQHLALPLAQALLGGRREIAHIGRLGGPDGRRDEGAAALFEQQQRRLARSDTCRHCSDNQLAQKAAAV
jgi:hypothetical protein